MKSLKELTNQLIELNFQANQIYDQVRESGQRGDFYLEVKPFANQVKKVSEDWGNLARKWLDYIVPKPKTFHANQIKATVENLELVSVQAFFPESSYKRFKNYVRSIDFVLKQLMDELQMSEESKDS
ncbi:hypothetical protein J2S13_000047 [Oikeobacillus pervagus]|uniref:DUF1798 family protein n=1 Tax=Oikeobacillus pervagus TaxID=1325931 RepID=A0AAJ1SVK1_9BACI|nr:YppE family protein [Oikeobacillus pervagus]MDQ0213653.1 hypothetical protein [Oikeobacillus pervagus]